MSKSPHVASRKVHMRSVKSFTWSFEKQHCFSIASYDTVRYCCGPFPDKKSLGEILCWGFETRLYVKLQKNKEKKQEKETNGSGEMDKN